MIHIDQDGYHETGGLAALTGFGRSTDVETTTLGLKAEATPFAAYPLTARLFLGWQHAFGDVDPKALVAFTAGSSAFAGRRARRSTATPSWPRPASTTTPPEPHPRHQLHRPGRARAYDNGVKGVDRI